MLRNELCFNYYQAVDFLARFLFVYVYIFFYTMQLDSVKTTSELNDSTPAIPVNKHEMCSDPSINENKKDEETDVKKITKDIKIIKRQNCITHNLLSALIVVTMIWQFGEVSVILAVKEKVTHPVRSIGDMIKGALTGKGKKSLLEGSTLIGGSESELSNGSFLLAPK